MTMWVGGDQGTRTQTEELVFRFKTARATGLLLVTSADSNSPDRLEISLVAGRVRANVRLGDREKVNNNNNNKLNKHQLGNQKCMWIIITVQRIRIYINFVIKN